MTNVSTVPKAIWASLQYDSRDAGSIPLANRLRRAGILVFSTPVSDLGLPVLSMGGTSYVGQAAIDQVIHRIAPASRLGGR